MATVQNLTQGAPAPEPVERRTRLIDRRPMALDVQLEIADTIAERFPLEALWLRNIARDHLGSQARTERRQ